MSLHDKKPVQLGLEIVNRENEAKMLSLVITISNQLSFDKSGFKTEEKMLLETMQPNEKRKIFLDIFSKPITRQGEQPIRIKVLEHYNDYKYVVKETKLDTGLRVV